MKRNFGVGEKEESSPGKVLGKILSGLGESVQAGLDAGSGTTHQKDKETKIQSALDSEAKAKAEKLAHDNAMKLINAGKADKKTKDDADVASEDKGTKDTEVEDNNETETETTPGKFLGGLIPKLPGLGK